MKNNDYEISLGNVFADLGLPNPEERLAKAKLAMQIYLIIEQKRLTQKEAANLLGIDQPKISALNKGKLAGFSIERLFRFLMILGQDININITPKKRTKKNPDISVNIAKVKRKPMSDNTTISRVVISAKKSK